MEIPAAQPNIEIDTNQYLQNRQDTITWLAEVLDGSMRSEILLHFDGRELWSEDGRAMGEVCQTALTEAEQMYEQSPQSGFELRRRSLEYEEYRDMLAIAEGKLPNTMIVVSDFPSELVNDTQDLGGYNVRRKQTMLRVIWRDEVGSMHIVSQSLDGSNRQALEELYKHTGYLANPGELLGQRLYKQLSPELQPFLIDELKGIYDRSLSSQFGGQWNAGRRGQKQDDTYNFVRDQEDLIDNFARQFLANPNISASMLYNLAANIEVRFNKANGLPIVARESYSGCGITVTAEGIQTNSLEQAGYGNKTAAENYKFDKYMHCVVCQVPPKKDEAKKMCGPCGICKACDSHMKSKMTKAA